MPQRHPHSGPGHPAPQAQPSLGEVASRLVQAWPQAWGQGQARGTQKDLELAMVEAPWGQQETPVNMGPKLSTVKDAGEEGGP